jgi:hypothetical protein
MMNARQAVLVCSHPQESRAVFQLSCLQTVGKQHVVKQASKHACCQPSLHDTNNLDSCVEAVAALDRSAESLESSIHSAESTSTTSKQTTVLNNMRELAFPEQ